MIWLILAFAALVIIGLAFYAGKLLFLLSKQNQRQKAARAERIKTISQSISTIAMAMEQQQCDLSEGTIRICNLLEALPVQPLPNFNDEFPAIFTLFKSISHFATLEARQALDKKTRRQQDMQREEIESKFESQVLQELPAITRFCAQLNS